MPCRCCAKAKRAIAGPFRRRGNSRMRLPHRAQPLEQGIIRQAPAQVRAETNAGMLRRLSEGRAGDLVSLILIAIYFPFVAFAIPIGLTASPYAELQIPLSPGSRNSRQIKRAERRFQIQYPSI